MWSYIKKQAFPAIFHVYLRSILIIPRNSCSTLPFIINQLGKVKSLWGNNYFWPKHKKRERMAFLKNVQNSSDSFNCTFFFYFLTPRIPYIHELIFRKVSLEDIKMAMRYAQKSFLAHFSNVHNQRPYLRLCPNISFSFNLKGYSGDHSFSTYTKFSEKLTFLTPRYAHVGVRIRG